MRPAVVRHFLIAPLLLSLLFLSACAMGEASRKKASYHYQMGVSRLNENNVAGALVDLTEAEKLNPDDPDIEFNLGKAYFLKNRPDLAEQKFLRSLALKPEFTEVRSNLGRVYLQMKRWDDAIYQFKLVTEDIFYPNPEAASINLGIAYLNKGDYPKALSTLRSASDNNPRDPIAKVYLGQVYLKLDKAELAIMELNRAIDLNKNYANAYYQLALAYLQVRNTAAALTAFREAVRISPESEIGRHAQEYLDVLK